MSKLRSKEHLVSLVFQGSLFLYCLFPFSTNERSQAFLATGFVVIQLVLIFFNANRNFRKPWLLLVQWGPFLLLISSLLYTSNLDDGIKKLETNILCMLIPLMFWFHKELFTASAQRYTALFFSIIMVSLGLYTIVLLGFNGTLVQAFKLEDGYFYLRTGIEEITGFHPTYLSIMLALAGVALIQKIVIDRFKTTLSYLYGLGIVVIVAMMILCMSKMILFAAGVTGFLMALKQYKMRRLLYTSSAVIAFSILLITLVKPLRYRVVEFYDAFTQETVDQQNPDSIRKGIYQATTAVINQNVILGTGVGDAQHELNAKYHSMGFKIGERLSLNTHNYYLHIWLSAGLFGLLSFLTLQSTHLILAFKTQNHLHIAFSVIMTLGSLTENILSRQDGVMVYAFFGSMLLCASTNQLKKLKGYMS